MSSDTNTITNDTNIDMRLAGEEVVDDLLLNSNDNVDSILQVDDHTILETLFFNEMAIMDTFYNNNTIPASTTTESFSSGDNTAEQQQQHQLEQNWNSSFDDLVVDVGHENSSLGLELDSAIPPIAENDVIPDIANLKSSYNVPIMTTSPAIITTSMSDNNNSQEEVEVEEEVAVDTTTTAVSDTQKQEHASELVSQFASLASKLGIHMPDSLLESLTSVAALREQQEHNSCSHPTTTTNIKSSSDGAATSAPAVASAAVEAASQPMDVNQWQENIAAASIAAAVKTQQQQVKSSNDTNTKSTSTSNANNNRKRKRPRIEECQTKLNRLRSENNLLKKYLANITNKREHLEQERFKTENQMKEMVKEGSSSNKNNKEQNNYLQEEIQKVLKNFSDMYADYGQCRKEELNFHLKQLEQLVIPTTFTKMTLWTLGQPTQFFQKPSSNVISNILMNELGITTTQAKKIISKRQHILKIQKNISETLDLVVKLKVLCEYKNQSFRDRMSKCQEILTPIQVMKLLIWVDAHSNMLEQVCPGWGSEMKIIGNQKT